MTMISNKIVPSNNGDLKACLTETDESGQLEGLPCREMSTAKEVAASTKKIPKSALSAQVRARWARRTEVTTVRVILAVEHLDSCNLSLGAFIAYNRARGLGRWNQWYSEYKEQG